MKFCTAWRLVISPWSVINEAASKLGVARAVSHTGAAMCDCIGYSKLWSLNAGEMNIRVNRDCCSLRSVVIVNDLSYTNIGQNIAGANLCCTCMNLFRSYFMRRLTWPHVVGKTFTFQHANSDIELEVNSFLLPSVYLFINGEEGTISYLFPH